MRSKGFSVDLPTAEQQQQLWEQFDSKGRLALPFESVDCAVSALWPLVDRTQAVQHAFTAVDADHSGLVRRQDFSKFLKHVLHFGSLVEKFHLLDTSADHRLDMLEFVTGCQFLGLGLNAVSAAAAFNGIDHDRSGSVGFETFVSWAVRRKAASNHSDAAEAAGTPAVWDTQARGDTPPGCSRHVRKARKRGSQLAQAAVKSTHSWHDGRTYLGQPTDGEGSDDDAVEGSGKERRRRGRRRKRTVQPKRHEQLVEQAGQTYTADVRHRHSTVPSHLAHKIFMGHIPASLARASAHETDWGVNDGSTTSLPSIGQWPPARLPQCAKSKAVEEAERRWSGEWESRKQVRHAYGRVHPLGSSARLLRSTELWESGKIGMRGGAGGAGGAGLSVGMGSSTGMNTSRSSMVGARCVTRDSNSIYHPSCFA